MNGHEAGVRERDGMTGGNEDHLPGLNSWRAWAKIVGILLGLVLVNAAAFLASFAFGVIITLPLTIFLAFLLLRDLMPRHRLPPGRPRADGAG